MGVAKLDESQRKNQETGSSQHNQHHHWPGGILNLDDHARYGLNTSTASGAQVTLPPISNLINSVNDSEKPTGEGEHGSDQCCELALSHI